MSSRTRRLPFWLILVAFVVIPIVEIWTIIQVGQVIGAWWTVLLLLAGGIVGSWLVKREGARAWHAFSTALSEGRMPHRELADGVLILFGGSLMITPGFLSDIVGVLMILPLTRPVGRRLLAGVISQRLTAAYTGAGGAPGGVGFARGPQPGPRRPEGRGDVVPGEVVDP